MLFGADTIVVGFNVTDFELTDIDPSLMLDPADTLAFVVGVSFTASGTGSEVVQTPIEANVSEPAALVILGTGLARLFGLYRRTETRRFDTTAPT